ncbi:MAG: HEAT repeat domain-containing protein, partial [Thermoflexales bacterium]|nr:HEAT repeat domain-containing protein [Thermoflexales bacterium]
TREYLRTAAREWRCLEAGDAEIPLTDVFVLLEAVGRRRPGPLERAPDLAEIPERVEHAGLTPGPEGPRPVGPEEVGAPVPLSVALREARHLVLLGEPGAGKTTTLQYIALWFAAQGAAADVTLHADLKVDEPCVPVRLDLRLLAEKLPASRAVLEEVLAGEVDRFLRKGPEVAQRLVREWRDSGRLFPLLDGLDEVPEGKREEVRKEITRFAASPDGSHCRVAVASRLAGYASLGGDFKEFILKPFQRPAEAWFFLSRWLAALKPEWREEAGERADRLLEEMGRTALRRITDNPLLLRMAAELYARKGEIARSRAELYRRWVEEEAWARALRRGAAEEEKKHALGRLEEVAWAMQNGLPLPELSRKEESLLRERMGLLARLGEERLVFAHRTFQEYFAARHLVRAWRANRPGAWAFLRPRLHLPEWREPLLLLAGELEGPEAADLVRRVLRTHRGLGEDARYERYLRRDFILALHLVGEAREFLQAIQTRLVARSRRLLGRRYVPSGLKRALIEALSALPADEALPDLLTALRDADVFVRLAAVMALGRIGDPHAVPGLLTALKDEEWTVRLAAAEALGRIGVPAVPDLLRVLRDADGNVRWAVAKALGRIGGPALSGLLGALRDADKWVRIAAAWALEKIGDPRAVSGFLEALRDADVDVRRAAAETLGRIGDPEAVPGLLEEERDEDG